MKSLLIVLSILCCAFGCRPIFRIYESRGWGEGYVENAVEMVALESVWDIAQWGLEHNDMYTCPQGVWLGYRYAGFAGANNLVYNYKKTGGAITCRYENSGRYFKSLRLVGHPKDYTASAVDTFQARYNEFAATKYLNDTESLMNQRFNSLILMGSEEMELFTGESYTGISHCIGPNNGNIYRKREYDLINHLRNGTELFTNLIDLEDIFGTMDFQSIRFGCSRI